MEGKEGDDSESGEDARSENEVSSSRVGADDSDDFVAAVVKTRGKNKGRRANLFYPIPHNVPEMLVTVIVVW